MKEIDLVMVGSIDQQNHARLGVPIIVEGHTSWNSKGADAYIPGYEKGKKKGVMGMGIGVIRTRDSRSYKVPCNPSNSQ